MDQSIRLLGWLSDANMKSQIAAPIIGDVVDVGSNVVIIGPIAVGSRSKISAGLVVVKDVSLNSVNVDKHAKVIKIGVVSYD